MRRNHAIDIWLGHEASRTGGLAGRLVLCSLPATGLAAGGLGAVAPVLAPIAQAHAAPVARWAGYWTPTTADGRGEASRSGGSG